MAEAIVFDILKALTRQDGVKLEVYRNRLQHVDNDTIGIINDQLLDMVRRGNPKPEQKREIEERINNYIRSIYCI